MAILQRDSVLNQRAFAFCPVWSWALVNLIGELSSFRGCLVPVKESARICHEFEPQQVGSTHNADHRQSC